MISTRHNIYNNGRLEEGLQEVDFMKVGQEKALKAIINLCI